MVSQPKIRKTWMLFRAWTERPMKLPVSWRDRQIIDAGEALAHEPAFEVVSQDVV